MSSRADILIVIPVLVGQISQLVVQIQTLISRVVDGSWNPVDELSAWLHSTFPALDVERYAHVLVIDADVLVAQWRSGHHHGDGKPYGHGTRTGSEADHGQ